MERFKAVEKEMKTKAFSKEGLLAAAKLDPKEKEKLEVCQFLSNMVEELDRQIETIEAEIEGLQANIKKSKKDSSRGDRVVELEKTTERHKWHQNKLELLLRALENGGVEAEPVKEIEDSIKYYVENNQDVDFMEDDSIYDEFNLVDEDDALGMGADGDKESSQDTQSVQNDGQENDDKTKVPITLAKAKSVEATAAPARRPSVHTKSPLPALATLHTTAPVSTNGPTVKEAMKPAPIPVIPTGQPLKYASAAAAAASSSDKSGVGIAPLPPPPTTVTAPSAATPPVSAPLPVLTATPSSIAQSLPSRPSRMSEPSSAQPSPALIASQPAKSSLAQQMNVAPMRSESPRKTPPISNPANMTTSKSSTTTTGTNIVTPALTSTTLATTSTASQPEEPESIYHLPLSLQDLLESFQTTKAQSNASKSIDEGMLNVSRASCPSSLDAERPNHYRPDVPYPYTPSHYPQEPLPIFDDPRLYTRLDSDSLFYAFYYRQGTYQQYLAAKTLKSQSWRFHKQYQTWFQRHEEPKNITEEYEQGTYRFFDYESTW